MVLAYNMCTAISHVAMFMTHHTKEKVYHCMRVLGQKLTESTKAKLLLVMDLLTFTVATYCDSLLNVSVSRPYWIQLMTKTVLDLQ